MGLESVLSRTNAAVIIVTICLGSFFSTKQTAQPTAGFFLLIIHYYYNRNVKNKHWQLTWEVHDMLWAIIGIPVTVIN